MQIVFLGRLAEQFGAALEVELSPDLTVADAIDAIAADTAEALTAPGISYVLDHQMVRPEQRLGNAQELAFLPPVSGG
ncbi:MAG: MoaD/ThiS family protein [Pseudomonadota bacterium]